MTTLNTQQVATMKCPKHSSYQGKRVPKVDCRPCRVVYVEAHSNENSSVVAESLGVDPRTVRRYRKDLGLTNAPLNQYDSETYREEAFLKFLLKGRIYKEIHDKFNGHADELLKRDYPGHALFVQRDRYGQAVYILLPQYINEVVLKPKSWHFHIAPPKNGLAEPFMMVQLPNFKDRIVIAPLFDVHYGNKAHRHEKFLAYLRWIAETPNVYAICGGDLMENALDDGRGMTYDQVRPPQNQLDEMTTLLSPIAHKILCMTTGNHEERTYKKSGIDVSRIIADRLKIPYFDGPIFMSVSGNTYSWNFYIQHGRGNSQTKGGKMNMAGRARKFTNNIHFFISGHVHDAIVEKETAITPNPVAGNLLYETQWTIVCQSFLGWADTYAYRAAYAPPSMGGVTILLDEHGEYSAMLT